MSNFVVPTIGSSGYFTLSAPFDTKILANTVYKCLSVRLLGDYINTGEDPYTKIYTANGLTEEDYKNDINDNIFIVSLIGESGQTVLVPSRYITSFPISTGVNYVCMTLGVSLGAIPVSLDLTALQTKVQNLIYDAIGIIPAIKPVQTSQVLTVSQETADNIEQSRIARLTIARSDAANYRKTQLELETALDKIRSLEDFIKNNM